MRIRFINPDAGMTEKELRERCEIIERYAAPDVKISMVCPQKSDIEIDSALDAALAAPELLQLAKKAEEEGEDAVILYCFSDPAIEAAREMISVPCVGAAQASLLTVPHICRRTAIILADPARIPEKRQFTARLGLDPARIGEICAIDLEGRGVRDDLEGTLDLLVKEGRSLREKSGAEAIVLGCLSFLGLAGKASEEIGIPVIDPALAALGAAESLVRQKLASSRVSYPAPPARRRSWGEGTL